MYIDLFEELQSLIKQSPLRLRKLLGESMEEVLKSFFQRNDGEAAEEILAEELRRINEGSAEYIYTPLSGDQRPLALILISMADFHELLYTKASVYAHLAKISALSAHFQCVCKLIPLHDHEFIFDLNQEVEELHERYPERELAYLHVISHGLMGDVWPVPIDQHGLTLDRPNNAHLSVTFEVCTTGDEDEPDCLARRFAELNPGVLTFAPKESVLHCVPLVSSRNGNPYVSAVLHLATSEWPRNAIEQLIESFLKGDSPQMTYELMPSFQSA